MIVDSDCKGNPLHKNRTYTQNALVSDDAPPPDHHEICGRFGRCNTYRDLFAVGAQKAVVRDSRDAPQRSLASKQESLTGVVVVLSWHPVIGTLLWNVL